MKLSQLGEKRCLEIIRRYTNMNPYLEIGFGDDAAVFRMNKKGERMALSTDMLVEGVHFLFPYLSYRDLGAKSYEVNASDMAAMGAWPVAAFLSLGMPPETEVRQMREFYQGFSRAAGRHECAIAGGDMVRSDRFIVCVTIIGKYRAGSRPLLRSDARPGHHVYVTGWPGESGMGLKLLEEAFHTKGGRKFSALVKRHLFPLARVQEGDALAQSHATGAVIDVSDGIYNELNHIALLSNVRLKIRASSLPISPLLSRASEMRGINPLDMVLFGGEDYELLFTSSLPPDRIRDMLKLQGTATPVHEIGWVEKGTGVFILDEKDRMIEIVDKTFQHFSLERR